MEIDSTIVIYREHEKYYLQHHDVAVRDSIPTIMEGRPLTVEALQSLCRAVLPSMISGLSFIDGRVLASSGTVHGPDIWWIPPIVRPMFFTELKIKNGVAPWPGLVMAASRGTLDIYTVKGDERPSPSTMLYVAPFFNMTGSSICLGNARKPAKNNDYAVWEEAVFKSAFSEERGEKRIKKGRLSAFWKKLIASGTKKFPEESLVSAKITVGQLIDEYKGRSSGGY